MPSFLSSNIDGSGDDPSCLCSASTHCTDTFSNTVGIPAAIIANEMRHNYY